MKQYKAFGYTDYSGQDLATAPPRRSRAIPVRTRSRPVCFFILLLAGRCGRSASHRWPHVASRLPVEQRLRRDSEALRHWPSAQQITTPARVGVRDEGRQRAYRSKVSRPSILVAVPERPLTS